MAYATSGLRLLVPHFNDGPALWAYETTDAHTAVDATDYFSDAEDRGMKANDIVVVVDTSAGTCTIHYVSAIDSDGNGTIAAATLA